jgi:predicted transcriptional regulator
MTSQAQEGLPFPQRLKTLSSQPKTMTDLLSLPDQERKLMNWLMRCRKASFTEIAHHLGGDVETAQEIVEQLFQAGFITTSEHSEETGEIVLIPKIMSRR